MHYERLQRLAAGRWRQLGEVGGGWPSAWPPTLTTAPAPDCRQRCRGPLTDLVLDGFQGWASCWL